MGAGKFNVKLYDELYAGMEKQLAEALVTPAESEYYAAAVTIVRASIEGLKASTRKGFADQKAEVAFFREVWPRFYARLYYYLLVCQFEHDRAVLPSGKLPALIHREEAVVARFFRQHREFWQYFRSGSPVIDTQFTREYSKSCLFDPLCQVLDSEGATLAGYHAAWGLAYEEYLIFLKQAAEIPEYTGRPRYEWKESKSAAVELIKSQVEAESIYINGKPATAAQLKAEFEEKYNEDLKDFDKLLYATDIRKSEPTPYLTKLVNAFMGRRKRLRK
jgi:hypothetical protein